ncbi:MAG: GNAT family N-acetyltransferase [Cohaesibacter sp.]|nr:GNAT family N-acetyltransferase [Cohaesibacter sp.]MCV6601762.1 GNAT family N-acetyltransferase [Cohaesibacter sp.]
MGALQGQHVYLRAPQKGDCEQWLSVRRQSADFLKPWEPVWPQDDLTPKGYQRRLNQYQKDARDGRSLPYFLFSTHTNQLLGGITLSNIRRGVCQSAMLGYWMGQSHAGKGLMFEAMAMLLPHLFDQYALHRIEAACLPHNQRSIALLQYLGFQHEGFARQYLCINGRWEDHQLFAILASDKRQ